MKEIITIIMIGLSISLLLIQGYLLFINPNSTLSKGIKTCEANLVRLEKEMYVLNQIYDVRLSRNVENAEFMFNKIKYKFLSEYNDCPIYLYSDEEYKEKIDKEASGGCFRTFYGGKKEIAIRDGHQCGQTFIRYDYSTLLHEIGHYLQRINNIPKLDHDSYEKDATERGVTWYKKYIYTTFEQMLIGNCHEVLNVIPYKRILNEGCIII